MDYRNAPQTDVAPFLAGRIGEQLLGGKKVLWLLSGGSGIDVCVQAGKILAEYNLTNVFVTTSDERYGDAGHANENMQQLLNAGLSLPGATIYRPINGTSIEQTTNDYSAWLSTAYAATDYRIALLGVGTDGHTSGIKPRSVAVRAQTAACYFTGEDFERVTTTAHFLARFDEAVVQAYGDAKQTVIQALIERPPLTYDEFPAGIIGEIPRVTLFTDIPKEEQK